MEYCKLSVVANAVTSVKEAIPWDDLQPYKSHFHPAPQRTESVYKRARPPGAPLAALQVIPSADQVCMPNTPCVHVNKLLFTAGDSERQIRRLGLCSSSNVCFKNDASPESHNVSHQSFFYQAYFNFTGICRSLGPGASNLLPLIGSKNLPPDQRIDLSKKVRDLDMREWCILVKAFDDWPFRPVSISYLISCEADRATFFI